MNAIIQLPPPPNEPVLNYAPKSPERRALRDELTRQLGEKVDLPLTIAGKRVLGNDKLDVRLPHKHRHVAGTLHMGDGTHVVQAIDAAMAARRHWLNTSFEDRAAVFLKAADLLAGPWRQRMNAACMLGQSKTPHQAEIDASCELIDFWRWNVHFASKLRADQPVSSPGTWNRLDYRPLDGFVLAVSPFNFTSIGGNLPTAPALMGNTVVWKPATTAALSSQVIMEILQEAGLPPGVINLVNAPGRVVGDAALVHRDLGGVHFTGSTGVFQSMWGTVANNIANFRAYPRLVGETGGKDFIVAHPSADVDALAVALVRGAFEYQGQKCSAASRAYIPESLWKQLAPRLEAEVNGIKMGDISDFQNFMGAVIDAKSFKNIKGYIDHAREGKGAEVWLGGQCDDSEGYFVRPTVVLATDAKHKLMTEEIFGPVLTIHRYPDNKFDDILRVCDETTPYALTGAIFAQDRAVVEHVTRELRFAAGNFYINDKPTGAVVGQQPFGGGRASGTNDKAGSMLNLVRWVSSRNIKENFVPPKQVPYPYMAPENG